MAQRKKEKVDEDDKETLSKVTIEEYKRKDWRDCRGKE